MWGLVKLLDHEALALAMDFYQWINTLMNPNLMAFLKGKGNSS